jgi:hypothetical protein
MSRRETVSNCRCNTLLNDPTVAALIVACSTVHRCNFPPSIPTRDYRLVQAGLIVEHSGQLTKLAIIWTRNVNLHPKHWTKCSPSGVVVFPRTTTPSQTSGTTLLFPRVMEEHARRRVEGVGACKGRSSGTSELLHSFTIRGSGRMGGGNLPVEYI